MSELLEVLNTGRDEWIRAVEPLSEAQWRYRPEADCWTPAECAEHIVKVEISLCKRISKGLSEGPAEPERAAAIAGKEEFLRKRVPGRLLKVKSPEPMLPVGRYTTPALFIEEFPGVRARTIELAQANDPGLDMFVMSHFAIGDLTGRQWLWFVALHAGRHLTQAREALATYFA